MTHSLPTDLGDLIRRAQDGSEEAAEILFGRCRPPLLAIIREELSHPLRRLFDSDDFLLITFAEIFTRHFSEEVLSSPQVLWRYLERIATNKIRDARRRYLIAERRNLNREVSLDSAHAEEKTWSKEFSPEDASMLKELVEERLVILLNKLPLVLRGMIQLIVEGYNAMDIARLLKLEPKRIYRAMDWLKRQVLDQ